MATKKKTAAVKSTAKKRSLNVGPAKKTKGDPFSNQDAKRRMGTFAGTGEHAHVGGRTSGIVGQTTRQFSTENRTKK
jgi:hypothetical protein